MFGINPKFPLYLWEIETWFSCIFIKAGNNNFHSTYERLKPVLKTKSPKFSCIHFHSTYERLKLDCPPSLGKLTINFHSTYERLKLVGHRQAIVNVLVFPLYLWEIETQHKLPISSKRATTDFHSTYERLKLRWFFTKNSKWVYFHSTYERLKLRWFFTKNSKWVYFHSTYERLKQDSIKQF